MATGFHRTRLVAGAATLAVSFLVLGLKLVAWSWTGSVAILSDALESIVNVAAASFAFFSLRLAASPPDRNHPYGHGKVEYFSAGLEGILILFASIAILVSAGSALLVGTEPQALDVGLLMVGVATVVNLGQGLYLVRVGRRSDSITLVADGMHLLTDVVTSCAVLAGLTLVLLTGWSVFDPIVALLAGLWIGWTGLRLMRRAIGGLMNELDPGTLERIEAALRDHGEPGGIHIHHLRAWNAGSEVNVDFHVTVPNYWTVAQGHDLGGRLARRIEDAFLGKCEVIVHLDPCEPDVCPHCAVEPCPIRAEPFHEARPQDLVGLVSGPRSREPRSHRHSRAEPP
jgi:cation diffusion facilitator family transporter